MKKDKVIDYYSCPITVIKLGGFDYTLEYMEPDKSMEIGMLGKCQNDDCRITICQDLNRFQLANTVVHELLHAVEYVMGLAPSSKDDDEVERTTCSLASGVCMLFRDNLALMIWILWLLTDSDILHKILTLIIKTEKMLDGKPSKKVRK